jgi:hypothetical protein
MKKLYVARIDGICRESCADQIIIGKPVNTFFSSSDFKIFLSGVDPFVAIILAVSIKWHEYETTYYQIKSS